MSFLFYYSSVRFIYSDCSLFLDIYLQILFPSLLLIFLFSSQWLLTRRSWHFYEVQFIKFSFMVSAFCILKYLCLSLGHKILLFKWFLNILIYEMFSSNFYMYMSLTHHEFLCVMWDRPWGSVLPVQLSSWSSMVYLHFFTS